MSRKLVQDVSHDDLLGGDLTPSAIKLVAAFHKLPLPSFFYDTETNDWICVNRQDKSVHQLWVESLS